MKPTVPVVDQPAGDTINSQKIDLFSGVFSITGLAPFYLDFTKEYPVFAISVRYTYAGDAGLKRTLSRYRTRMPYSRENPIYAKNIYLLVADQNRKFQWVSPADSSVRMFGFSKNTPDNDKHRLTRYSLDKGIGEHKDMIYPIRQFSITGITMDGFDPEKEYPVLAIDTDQYMDENQEPEEDAREQQPASRSLAFFLVGDDNGEFAWIAEDECRLFPLKT